MAAKFTEHLLSGSTNGKPILIAATATPGTIIHTADSGADVIDNVYLWVANTTGSNVDLTIEWGGVSSPGDHYVALYKVAGHAIEQIAFGQPIAGGLIIRAFASSATALTATGKVLRYSV
jgi:hypothetical protein